MVSIEFSRLGNEDLLLNRNTCCFLCSHKVPNETFDAIRAWADSLNPATDCVICGCLAGVERFALKYLLGRHVPIILALAEAVPDDIAVLSEKLKGIMMSDAMGAGRLLIVSATLDRLESEASGKNAELRNRLMMQMAGAGPIIVGYATPLGGLARQLLIRHNVKYLVPSATSSNGAVSSATAASGTVPSAVGNGTVPSATNENSADSDEIARTNMGWAIYNTLKENYGSLGSLEVRKLLNQYLKLGISHPCRLHSLILFLVVKNFDTYPDLKFAAFFRIWGPDNLQDEDWKATKVNDNWFPSLAERVIGKLFKVPEGGRFRDIDKPLIHLMLDKAFAINPRNQKFAKYREKLEKIENWRPRNSR